MPARDSVVAELAATRAYSGATGVFGFDPEGDTTLRLVSIFRPAGPDPDPGWQGVASAAYSAALPYCYEGAPTSGGAPPPPPNSRLPCRPPAAPSDQRRTSASH